MRTLVWALRAVLFFTLFAFALNNQHEVSVHWFFDHAWNAPLIIIVLVVFALGCSFGVLAMVPAWWRQRRQAQRKLVVPASTPSPASAANDGLNYTQTLPDEL